MLLRTVPIVAAYSGARGVVGAVWADDLSPGHSQSARAAMAWSGCGGFEEYTAAADPDLARRMDARLLSMLRELHESPQVLIVFNHPLWDLHKVGPVHQAEVLRFLREAGGCVHAMELNGLRHVRENRDAAQLAKETGHLVISGGDRHGLEPNANINLTLGCELYGVCGGDSRGPRKPRALYAAVSGAVGAEDLPVDAERGDGLSGVHAGVAAVG